MLEQLPDGVLVTDTTGAILWANRGAVEITGWPIAELRGMRLDQMMSPDELTAIARARGVVEGPWGLRRYHCLLRTKSGERQEVSVSMGRIEESGVPAAIVLLRDLRRQRELERRLSEQVAEKQEVEDFGRAACLVVHDLRNLNNIMSLTVRTFRQYLDDPSFREEVMRTLEAVARDMKYLTEKLSGPPTRISLHRQAILLGEVVLSALDLLEKSGRKAEVAATDLRGLEGILPCEVDIAEMQWVLFNVLLNAFEAVEGRGQVSIIGHHDAAKGQVRLVIEDTGPGIPQHYLEGSLFRPFRSTKPRGLGLGLYQAKAVIEAHGGTIEVKNREGRQGTSVTITLPEA
jgi:PAS domain S-box-containing protein